jgi:hypothetical protein
MYHGPGTDSYICLIAGLGGPSQTRGRDITLEIKRSSRGIWRLLLFDQSCDEKR